MTRAEKSLHPKPTVKPRRWWSLSDRRKAKDMQKMLEYYIANPKGDCPFCGWNPESKQPHGHLIGVIGV